MRSRVHGVGLFYQQTTLRPAATATPTTVPLAPRPPKPSTTATAGPVSEVSAKCDTTGLASFSGTATDSRGVASVTWDFGDKQTELRDSVTVQTTRYC